MTSIRLTHRGSGVRLTAYSGESADLPAPVLQQFCDDAAAGRLRVPIDSVYALEQISAAHRRMERGDAAGKLVVRINPG